MGCNCGGSQRQAAQPRGRERGGGDVTPALRGPQAPNYFFTGPKKRAERNAKKS